MPIMLYDGDLTVWIGRHYCEKCGRAFGPDRRPRLARKGEDRWAPDIVICEQCWEKIRKQNSQTR